MPTLQQFPIDKGKNQSNAVSLTDVSFICFESMGSLLVKLKIDLEMAEFSKLSLADLQECAGKVMPIPGLFFGLFAG